MKRRPLPTRPKLAPALTHSLLSKKGEYLTAYGLKPAVRNSSIADAVGGERYRGEEGVPGVLVSGVLWRVHPLCAERTAQGKEGEIGYQRQGGIIAVHPHLLLHIHTLALALALLRDAPAAASNSLPDSRIAELPKSMPRRPCPLPTHSLGSRSLFDASIKTHRVLFVHLSGPDLEDAAA
jgi:hypothetical protein